MSEKPAKPVLLTGASGALGRTLTKSLSAQGWTLRLTDIAPFPDAVPAGADFTRADLNDGVTLEVFSALLKAEVAGVVDLPAPLLEQIPRHLAECASRPLNYPIDVAMLQVSFRAPARTIESAVEMLYGETTRFVPGLDARRAYRAEENRLRPSATAVSAAA